MLIGNYARQPIDMVRGEGSLLWDADAKRYLDLFAGFGGSILGHCHPALIAAAHEQAQKLWHVGNTFYTDGGSRYVTLFENVSFDNPQGVTDFGPCGLPSELPLCAIGLSSAAGQCSSLPTAARRRRPSPPS